MKNIVVWSFERKFAEYAWGRWLIENVFVKLDILYTQCYFGLQGKCPFCGKFWIDHHAKERAEGLERIRKAMEEINVTNNKSTNS